MSSPLPFPDNLVSPLPGSWKFRFDLANLANKARSLVTACLVFGGRVSKQNTSRFICYLLPSSLKNCHSAAFRHIHTMYILDDCFLKRTEYPYYYPCKMGMNCKWSHFARFKESLTSSLGEAEAFPLTLQMVTCWVSH